ncbi:MAG: hypothetical protein A3J45_05885 [Candidatus Rokubacteria bacterium RIFCSPHIGHO2_02_FULL_69_13]|nr:MAG: hypothetical protein A3J45_05885 [Candidatus Rokubacteria bacterium RIFCSPHIGHO2_02_FULL_69_13]
MRTAHASRDAVVTRSRICRAWSAERATASTVGPLPDITLPSAPALMSARLIRPIWGCAGSTTASRALYRLAATRDESREASACISPFVRRPSSLSPAGTSPYTSRVESGKSGFTSTSESAGLAGSGSIRSPRPVARARPPLRKNGTSIPRATARSASRAPLQRRPQSRFSPQRAAAASLEPPPSPAATGIRFSRVIRAPRFTPAASIRSRAALTTRFASSVGRAGSLVLRVRASSSSRTSRSNRSTAWSTVESSW